MENSPRSLCMFLTIVLACCQVLPVSSQEVVLNEQGQRIIVYPDGSWLFFEGDSTGLDELSGTFSPEDAAFRENFQEIEKIRLEEDRAVLELIKTRLEQAACKLVLDSLQAPGMVTSAATIVHAKGQLENAVEKERQLENKLEKLKEKRLFYGTLLYLTGEARDKKIAAWEASAKSETEIKDKEKSPVVEKGEVSQGSADQEDLLLNPPPSTCHLAFEGADPVTGQQRKDIEPATIFSFTGRELEDHFKYNDLIACSGYLTSITGGYRFLTLEIAVASKNAPKIFGLFEAGSILDLVLMDATVVRLLNQKKSAGTWQPRLNAHVYRCSYPIGRKEEKLLRNMELDKIKLRWSKASEEFDVYNLDFFIQQFGCLDR
ncbi:MAG: hypothetical protein H6577_13985 [Lewinellaceae bacterium]|nr:hypothetical protein [Saprospiraceae bacterium]MCB9339237.1 hypothetical protein [Lewinellaceae bacterium]